MDNCREIDKVIHDQLVPLQQMFKSYEQLAHNSFYHISPKVFKKCYVEIQTVINIARDLTKEEK